MDSQNLSFIWQGITIDVQYTPDYSPSIKKIYGWTLAHLSIERRGAGHLPISKTGYRSHFTAVAAIIENGGPEAYLKAWLDETANSETWQKYIAGERQMKLF